ncbi:zinc-binding alcohol dehydrogenase family protein [Isoptericola sp. BMS4]|uniref:quinone oxidoreductase family protein n=1 Tax=Isoptericola sp. BMS4 TaxID=2527875 RepID=UPI00196AB042|nr:zinc-binding alcohol dehydrogenase family protein [Isoptericola sp. BMS4]
MGTLMQALVFDGPARDTAATRVAAVERPAPGPGQVAIAVEYAGINFKDVMARRGDGGYAQSWPFVPGLEVAGHVLAVGPGVDTPEPGQRVAALTNTGGLAEVAVADAALTTPLPAGLDPAVAAVVPGAPTTADLLVHDVARVRDGDVVAVHSASGAVGAALAPLARLAGAATLVGIVGAPSRVPLARDAGYDSVHLRGPGLVESVREAAPGGADVVLDPQGTTALEDDLAVLRPTGQIVLFGNAGGCTLDPLPTTGRLYATNARIGGFSLESLSRADPARVRRALTRVVEHLAASRLSVQPTVLDGLAAAPAAQERLATGTGSGKYVVRVR